MPTLNVSEDGYIGVTGQSSWDNARDATTGTVVSNSGTSDFANAYHTSGRGSNDFRVTRTFMYFDTSGITDTLADATLKLYGFTQQNSADIIVVKSTAFGGDGGTALAAGDMDSFATGAGNDYSSEFTTMTNGQFNNIPLNATALADIKNNDAFIICIMEYDHDHQDSAPSNASFYSSWRNGGYSVSSLRPDLEYNIQLGYSHDIIGVPSANISTINAVATANVEKVISA